MLLSLSICVARGTPAPASPRPPYSCDTNCARYGAADYFALLDAVFPHAQRHDTYFVLRYIPASETEFQIVITKKDNESYSVESYFLPKGSKRIGDQLLQLKSANPNDTTENLARHIAVEHKSVELDPGTVSELMGSLAAVKISPELSSDIAVDAPMYEFWFVAASACNVVHLRVSDPYQDRSPKTHALVRWMKRVRGAIQAAETKH